MSETISLFSRDNLDELLPVFERYWLASRKSRPEALIKMGSNFAGFVIQRMKAKQNKSGDITAERIAGFRGGEGLRITDRVRGLVYKKYGVVSSVKSKLMLMTGSHERKNGVKTFSKSEAEKIAALNKSTGGKITLQALLVETELKHREGHRAFSTAAWIFPGMKNKYASGRKMRLQEDVYSGGNFKFGRAHTVERGAQADELHFDFGPRISKWSGMAARGISSPRYGGVIDGALRDTKSDMLVYLARDSRKHAADAKRGIKKLLG